MDPEKRREEFDAKVKKMADENGVNFQELRNNIIIERIVELAKAYPLIKQDYEASQDEDWQGDLRKKFSTIAKLSGEILKELGETEELFEKLNGKEYLNKMLGFDMENYLSFLIMTEHVKNRSNEIVKSHLKKKPGPKIDFTTLFFLKQWKDIYEAHTGKKAKFATWEKTNYDLEYAKENTPTSEWDAIFLSTEPLEQAYEMLKFMGVKIISKQALAKLFNRHAKELE